MCFSAEASIQSFIAGIIGSYLTISLGSVDDKIIGYFLGFVSLMQGIEYLLWNHQKCDKYNQFLSYSGMILNHIQPIVFAIIILYFNPKTEYTKTICSLIIIYTLVIIPYSLQYVKEKTCTLKSKCHPHLVWNWNNMKYANIRYITFISVVCLTSILGFPNKIIGIMGAIGLLVSYTTSKIVYPKDAVGALWCYYIAFVPLIYYMLKSLFIKLL